MRRQKKERLVQLLRAKKEKEMIFYSPFDYQDRVHRSNKKFRIVTAGNQVGKTMVAMREALWWALDCHPYLELPNKRRLILIAGPSMELVDQGLFTNKISQWIPPSKIKKIKKSGTYVSELHFENGNIIYFKSYEKGREKLQALDVDLVVIDEQPEDKIFGELVERTSATKGKLILSFTPLKVDLDLRRSLEKIHSDEVEWFRFSKYDCPMYTTEEVDRAVAAMHPANARARIYGEWITWSGRLLPNFDQEKNAVEPYKIPEKWRRAVTVDPATTGETAVAFLAEVPYQDKWIIYKTATFKELAPSELVMAIEKIEPEIMDYCARYYDEAAAWFRTEASKKGIYYSAVKKHGNNENMVNKLNQAFHEENLTIFNTEKVAIDQFINYANKENSTEFAPIKKDDHFPDALKYFIWAKPLPIKVPKNLSYEERMWKAVDKQVHKKSNRKGHPKLGRYY